MSGRVGRSLARCSAKLRAVDRRVWLVTALFTLVSTGWALAIPLFHPPDEPMHVDLISALADDPAYPGYADRQLDARLSSFSWSYLQAGGGAHDPRLGNLAVPAGTDTTVQVPGGSGPSSKVDQMPQHPPLYYEAMALVLRAGRALHPGGSYPTIAVEVLLLRLVNVLLVVPLPLLTWLIARELGAGDRGSLSAACLLLAVPQLNHIVGSVNNDNLLIVLGAALTLLVVRAVRRPLSWPRDVGLGLVLGAALLTKAFAFVFVPWVLVAYVIAGWRQREAVRAGLGLAAAGALSAVLAGWFWLWNLHRYGQVAPTTFFEEAPPRPAGQTVDHMRWLREFVELLPQRFWASIGRYAASMPMSVVIVASALVVVCLVAAVVARPRPGEGDRVASVMAVVPVVLLGAYVAQHAHHIFVVTGWLSFIQGRYLFAGIGGLMAVTAIGADRLTRGWFGPLGALAVAAVLQVIAGFVVLTVIWGGTGVSLIDSVTTMIVWSPLPGPAVVAVGAVTVAVAVALVWSLVRDAPLRSSPTDRPTPVTAGS